MQTISRNSKTQIVKLSIGIGSTGAYSIIYMIGQIIKITPNYTKLNWFKQCMYICTHDVKFTISQQYVTSQIMIITVLIMIHKQTNQYRAHCWNILAYMSSEHVQKQYNALFLKGYYSCTADCYQSAWVWDLHAHSQTVE